MEQQRKLLDCEKDFVKDIIERGKHLENPPTPEEENMMFARYLNAKLVLMTSKGKKLEPVQFPQFIDTVRQYVSRHGTKDKKVLKKEKEAKKKVDVVARYKKDRC